MISCPSCHAPLAVVDQITTTTIWEYSEEMREYLPSPSSEAYADPRCHTCGHPVGYAALNIRRISKRYGTSPRTRFHESYKERPDIYEAFCNAEDPESVVLTRLADLLDPANKVIIDLGAGSCKYATLLAPLAKRIIALDPAGPLLRLGEAKAIARGAENIIFLKAFAESIPLLDHTIDGLYSTWATFDLHRTWDEVRRVVRHPGPVVMVGAHGHDEFSQLWPEPIEQVNHTCDYNRRWFELRGFHSEVVHMQIAFDSPGNARDVLGYLLGKRARDLIESTGQRCFEYKAALLYRLC